MKESKLSGVIEFSNECPSGYYQVKLQGTLENANIQVVSETDTTGKFEVSAPAGHYIMFVKKGQCGSKETIELENNTEHMLSVAVRSLNSNEKESPEVRRVPASILQPELIQKISK